MEQANETATVMEWPRWMRLNQASKYSGMCINTFKKHLVSTGRVKAHIYEFGSRYDKEEIDKAMQSGY